MAVFKSAESDNLHHRLLRKKAVIASISFSVVAGYIYVTYMEQCKEGRIEFQCAVFSHGSIVLLEYCVLPRKKFENVLVLGKQCACIES